MADDKKYLSKIVKGSDTLWIKDAEARADIEDIKSSITGGMHYLGKSTTAIADGDATGPWVIDGVTYIASGTPSSGQKLLAAGDIAIYQELEFIWSGASGKWQEFGSTGSLKALAFKDTASATYTPAGTNADSAVTFTGQTTGNFVTGYDNDGVAPSFTEGAFDAGSLPSFTEGQFTPAAFQTGFYSEGTAPSLGSATTGSFVTGFDVSPVLPSKEADTWSAGSLPSLGTATTGNFNTDGEKSTYDETNETLTLVAASTSAAVTAQGTFDAGSLPSFTEGTFSAGTAPTLATSSAVTAQGTFSAGSVTTLDLTKFSGGSKASDTFSAGSLPSKASDTFNAGSAASLVTSAAVTAVGTGTAAGQTFSGTEATITVS